MRTPAVGPRTVLLDKYVVEEVLGRGGMGVVVRARHLTLEEVVAIKVLAEHVRIDAETFARFVREARAASKLRSKHVVRVSDVGKLPDGMPYMVMELLEGRDLGQILKHTGPVGASFATTLVIQACEALSEAHALGIVHRDIKPSNLFVSHGEGASFAKLLDFGIAKDTEHVDFSLTRTASMLGTPGYMSPEQLRSSRTVDARTDLWSLGVLLYEVLEGQRPFQAEMFSELCLQIDGDPPPPMTRTAPALAAVILRCLEKQPDDRFQSAIELATALAPFATDPRAAYLDIERMHRVMRSIPERGAAEPLTPTPPGRFGPTAAVGVPGGVPSALVGSVGVSGVLDSPAPPPAPEAPGVSTRYAKPSPPNVDADNLTARPTVPLPNQSQTDLRPRRRRTWLVALTALVATSFGITAVVLASRRDQAPAASTAPGAGPEATNTPDAAPVAVAPDASAIAPDASPVAHVDPPPTDHKPRGGSKRPKKPPPAGSGSAGSASTPPPPATGSNAGSASAKPCSPFGERHGC